MRTQLDSVFRELFFGWLEAGSSFQAEVNGVAKWFAGALSAQFPEPFTFSALGPTRPSLLWSWRSVEWSDVFDGPFAFFVPTAWSEARAFAPQRVAFDEDGVVRQTATLSLKEHWVQLIRERLDREDVGAFQYQPLHLPPYDRWVFATAPDGSETWTVVGAYGSGDWLVVLEGEVPRADDEALVTHLTAATGSNPWAGWIEAAQRLG